MQQLTSMALNTRLFLSILMLFMSVNIGLAQSIDIGPPDTSICDGQPITLTAITSGVGSGVTTETDFEFDDDDQHGPIVDIGFPFQFFGNTYTQCVVSTNGYITFDLGTANTNSPWGINNPSPTPGVPDNSIMFPWQDINPGSGNGGTNAADCGDGVFVVDFTDIAMFSCTSLSFSMQVKLYEGTNIIETHITNKPLCTTWNDGAAIHGLENSGGTQSVIVPGRNYPSQWSVTDDAVRFTPDGLGGYTIDQTIPFNPTPVGNEVTEWTDGQGNFLGNTNQITVTPAVPTWYYCSYRSSCSTVTVEDSILVTLGNVNMSLIAEDASCFGSDDGLISVDPDGSNYPVSFTLEDTAANQLQQINGISGIDTIEGLTAGTYNVIVTDQVGCETSLNVDVGEPTELVIEADHLDILCNGDNNGVAWVNASGSVPPYDYEWNDPLEQVSDSIRFLPPGAYTVLVTDSQNCFKDTTITVSEPLPLILDMSSGPDTCLYKNGSVIAQMQGGVTPYQYIWSSVGGDSSNYTLDTITYAWSKLSNLSSGDYSVMVIDSNGCELDGSATVGLINPPVSDFLTRSKPEEFVNPYVQFDNESFASLSYEWNFGDGEVSFEENPEHRYDTSGVFLVMLIAYNDPIYGCADTAFRYVEVDPFFTFYVPNGFTPDGDGLNDTWGPVGQSFEIESYNAQVYDRWGKLIWQTDNPEKRWDGKNPNTLEEAKQGMYAYVFTVKKFNTFEPKIIKGTVSVYRHN